MAPKSPATYVYINPQPFDFDLQQAVLGARFILPVHHVRSSCTSTPPFLMIATIGCYILSNNLVLFLHLYIQTQSAASQFLQLILSVANHHSAILAEAPRTPAAALHSLGLICV